MSGAEQRTLRLFIYFPADVRPERLIAERVVRRLHQVSGARPPLAGRGPYHPE